MSRPKDYLGCIDGAIVLADRKFPITLDIYGRSVPAVASPDGTIVVDRVMLEQNDISVELPSEAMELLTAHVNARRE